MAHSAQRLASAWERALGASFWEGKREESGTLAVPAGEGLFRSTDYDGKEILSHTAQRLLKVSIRSNDGIKIFSRPRNGRKKTHDGGVKKIFLRSLWTITAKNREIITFTVNVA